MRKSLCLIMLYLFLTSEAYAYKVFYYDSEGNRLYRTVEQKDFAKYKNAKRRTFVRVPRTNWEITDTMRARKRPYYYKGKN